MIRLMRALLLVVLAGCAGAEAMSLATPPPAALPAGRELGLHPGETMAYDVQLAGVLVGEAQLAVGEIGMVDGKKAIVVRSRAATAGAAALVKQLSDEATTVIDVETGHPLSVDTVVVTGGKKITAGAKFAGRVATVTYKRSEEAAPQTLRVDFRTAALHDMHSAMAAMRGWRGWPGDVRTVHLIGGRRLWKIDMKYIGEETIGSAVGNRRAIVLEGTSFKARRDLTAEPGKATRTFRVWLSNDADRVPLKCSAKTELGDIVMDLVEYTRP
jgi:hypothetical protein